MSYTMTYDSLLVDLRRYLERGFTEASDQIVFDQIQYLQGLMSIVEIIGQMSLKRLRLSFMRIMIINIG